MRRADTVSIAREWMIVFAVALAVYAATASRVVQWQDQALFLHVIYTRQVVSPLGLALTHALHFWLGRAALWVGIVEPPYALALVSALGGALAVANVYGCVRYVTGSRWAAVFAAASLGVAHTFWRLSTVIEVYTLSAALLAGECWCLAAFVRTRRAGWLWGTWLLNGLGVANHLQGGLTSPVLLVVTLLALSRRQVRLWEVVLAGALWIGGSLPWTMQVIAAGLAGGDWPTTLRSAFMGEQGRFGQSLLKVWPTRRTALERVCSSALSFCSVPFPAAAYGMVRWRRLGIDRLLVGSLLAGLVIHAFFAVRYNVVDQHTFFLPTYVLLTVFGGIGAAAVLALPASVWRHRLVGAAAALLIATPALYGLMPPVARHLRVLKNEERHKPYRDDYVYLFSPWGVQDTSCHLATTEAVRLAGPGGLILVEDPAFRAACRYQVLRMGCEGLEVRQLPASTPQASDRRLRVMEEALRAVEAGRGVVWVPESLGQRPPAGLSWRRAGDLYLAAGVATRPVSGEGT